MFNFMKLLREILEELKDLHYHFDRLENMYMYVNKVHIITKEELKKENKLEKEIKKE